MTLIRIREYIPGHRDTREFPTIITYTVTLGKSFSNAIQKSKVFTMNKNMATSAQYLEIYTSELSESRPINYYPP